MLVSTICKIAEIAICALILLFLSINKNLHFGMFWRGNSYAEALFLLAFTGLVLSFHVLFLKCIPWITFFALLMGVGIVSAMKLTDFLFVAAILSIVAGVIYGIDTVITMVSCMTDDHICKSTYSHTCDSRMEVCDSRPVACEPRTIEYEPRTISCEPRVHTHEPHYIQEPRAHVCDRGKSCVKFIPDMNRYCTSRGSDSSHSITLV